MVEDLVEDLVAIQRRIEMIPSLDDERGREHPPTREAPLLLRERGFLLWALDREDIQKHIDRFDPRLAPKLLALWDEFERDRQGLRQPERAVVNAAAPARPSPAATMPAPEPTRASPPAMPARQQVPDGSNRAERESAMVQMVRLDALRAERATVDEQITAFWRSRDVSEAERTRQLASLMRQGARVDGEIRRLTGTPQQTRPAVDDVRTRDDRFRDRDLDDRER